MDDDVTTLADAACNDALVTGHSAAAEVLPFSELDLPWPSASEADDAPTLLASLRCSRCPGSVRARGVAGMALLLAAHHRALPYPCRAQAAFDAVSSAGFASTEWETPVPRSQHRPEVPRLTE